jgi:arylformamidase
MLYDITPSITTRTNVWPGDTPISREMVCDMANGDNITLSALRATVHLGAHADGPNHYSHPAPGVGERDLNHYLGPCVLIDADIPRGQRVALRHLRITDPARPFPHPRVLIRTGTFPDFEHWNADFAALDPSLVEALAAANVTTIGIDTPSVDLQDSKDLPAHHAIARHDISILEGLALQGVPAGAYELIALPLKLIGFDASPIRAVLRTLTASR